MKTLKVFLRSFLITSSILTFTFFVFGADGNIDESFTASAVRAKGSNLVDLTFETSLKQSDGKILIAGNFQTLGGLARNGIARLNADGTIDTTFNPPEILGAILSPSNQLTASMIYAIALQADGKIVIGGDFTLVGGVSRNKIARLNADGSPDVTFNANVPSQFDAFNGVNVVRSLDILPDGRILLTGRFCYVPPTTGNRCLIGRLNPDGTNDNSFSASTDIFEKIKLLPDGKILNFGSAGIKRLTGDGGFDSTFEATFSAFIEDAVVLPNNQIVIVGSFTTIQGFSARRIARLFSNGTVDVNFNTNGSGADATVNSVYYTSDGKFLIGGGFTSFNGVQKVKIARLNSNGTPDNSFVYQWSPAVNDGVVTELSELNNGNILVGGKNGYWNRIQLINSNGSIFTDAAPLIGMSAFVNAIAQQADGKILVGGRFTVANGVARNNLVRYNTDGTIDTTFVPLTNIAQFFIVRKIYPLADGKILVAMQGERGLARLNSNGSLDTSFNLALALSSDVRDIEVQSDGKIIAVGSIVRMTGGTYATSRYDQNGNLDSSFAINNISGTLNASVLQPDGKLIVVGEFSQIVGATRGRVARLNTNGTIDTSFNPPGGANAQVRDVALQSDGKVVLVGDFSSLNGSSAQKYVGRLNADGELDTSFSQSANYSLNTVKIQDDGKILVGGSMTTVGGSPRSGIVRLNSNGALDNTFQTGIGTNGPVYDIELQPDKKVLVGGDFTKYNDVSKLSVMRLQNSNTVTPVKAKFDFDGDGRTDIVVYRPSTSVWYQLLGQNYQFSSVNFGIAEDILAPADYDGDGKTDLGIFRPSTGAWWYRSSAQGNAFRAVQWGQSGDIPLPSDINGDGKDDYVFYRPSNNTWYRLTDTESSSTLVFGLAGDKPVIGDFDGDGKADPAVFRPSTGVWWYAASSQNNAFRAIQFGASGDIPAAADYDGDGKTDVALFRPSNGGWYILNSGNNSVTIIGFGLNGDKPIAGDYDGDGKADISVYRPSNGTWYLYRSTAGFAGIQLGTNTDIPIPNAFVQ